MHTPTTDSPESCAYTFIPSCHSDTTITDEWSCPHDAHEDSDYCLFHMTPDERDVNGVTDTLVQDTLITKLKTGDPNERVFYDAHIPALTISYFSYITFLTIGYGGIGSPSPRCVREPRPSVTSSVVDARPPLW